MRDYLFIGGPADGRHYCTDARPKWEVEDHYDRTQCLNGNEITFHQEKRIWTYSMRVFMVDDREILLYAPESWSNFHVMTELIKGYRA